jgi:hypothetical protein
MQRSEDEANSCVTVLTPVPTRLIATPLKPRKPGGWNPQKGLLAEGFVGLAAGCRLRVKNGP